MSLGDRVIILIDMGAGKVREETVTAGSAGGNVRTRLVDGSWYIEELTRTARSLRSVVVPDGRLVATIEVPKGR
jgi:hypothetical protein